MTDTFIEKFTGCAKACGLFVVVVVVVIVADCAFPLLIGWAGKLRSRGKEHPNPRDRGLPAEPISIRKAQSRKKSPQTFAHLVNFSKYVCHV